MKRSSFILALLSCASIAFAQAAPMRETPPQWRETISVTGTGRSTVTPDRVRFDVSVQTVGQTVDEAVNENNAKVAAVIAALKKGGARDADIRTSNFAIYPQQDYQQGKLPRILGYNVSNSIMVTRPNPAEASKLLQAAINAGVNQSSGLSFEVSDPYRGRDIVEGDAPGAGGRTRARSRHLDQRRGRRERAAASSVRHGDAGKGRGGERNPGRGRYTGELVHGLCCVRITLKNQWFSSICGTSVALTITVQRRHAPGRSTKRRYHMENRDRDKMSKNVGSTSAGDVNRSTSSNLDKSKDESQSSFGKNIGRSEDLSNEPSRRSGSVGSSGMQGSTGRSSQGSSSSDLGSSGIDSSKSSGSSRGDSGSERH